MKPNIVQSLIAATLLAVTPTCLWGASLKVLGNVEVEGDGTTTSPGDILAAGSVEAIDLLAHRDIHAAGNVVVSGNLTTVKNAFGYLSYYYIELKEGDPYEKSCKLGIWDLCILSEVRITGQDNDSSDVGECKVAVPDGIKNQSLADRPTWTLTGYLGNDVDEVRCAAICLSFATECTGNCEASCSKG